MSDKRLEPRKPVSTLSTFVDEEDEEAMPTFYNACPNCGVEVFVTQRYCSWCGQALTWVDFWTNKEGE